MIPVKSRCRTAAHEVVSRYLNVVVALLPPIDPQPSDRASSLHRKSILLCDGRNIFKNTMLPELDAVGSDAAGSWACQSMFGRPEHCASESSGAGGSTVPTLPGRCGCGHRRSFIQRVPDRVDLVERHFLAGACRLRRLIWVCFARSMDRRRRERRDSGGTDMFGRI